MRIAFGIFFLVFGIFWVMFASTLGKVAVQQWGQTFGLTPSRTLFQIIFFIIGLGFVLSGLLVLTGRLEFPQA